MSFKSSPDDKEVSPFSSPFRKNSCELVSPISESQVPYPQDVSTVDSNSTSPTLKSPVRLFVPRFTGLHGSPYSMGLSTRFSSGTIASFPYMNNGMTSVADAPASFDSKSANPESNPTFGASDSSDTFYISPSSHCNPQHQQQRTTFM